MAYQDVVPAHLTAVSPESCQPGLPSFLEHVQFIPDAGTLHSLSLCPGMVLPQISREMACSVFQFSLQKIISERSSLTYLKQRLTSFEPHYLRFL